MASLSRKRKGDTPAQGSVAEFDVGNSHGPVSLVFDSDMDPDAAAAAAVQDRHSAVDVGRRADRVVSNEDDSHAGQRRQHGRNQQGDGAVGGAFDDDGGGGDDDDDVPERAKAKRSRRDRGGISDGRQLHELAIGAYEAAQEKEWVRRHAHAHAQLRNRIQDDDNADDVDEHDNDAMDGGDDGVDEVDDEENDDGESNVLTSGSVRVSQRSRQGKSKHRGGSGGNGLGAPLPVPLVSSGANALVQSELVHASEEEISLLRSVFGQTVHFNRKWQRVAQIQADGTEGRPYWYHIDTGATSWVPPPPPPASRDPSTFASSKDAGAPGNTQQESEHKRQPPLRSHRKYLTPRKVTEQFPDEGFFVGPNQALRCMCSRKECGPWDREMVRRHIMTKTHMRMCHREVTVPMSFYHCQVSMPQLAKLAVAVTSTAASGPWISRRKRKSHMSRVNNDRHSRAGDVDGRVERTRQHSLGGNDADGILLDSDEDEVDSEDDAGRQQRQAQQHRQRSEHEQQDDEQNDDDQLMMDALSRAQGEL